jgi:hypothetical protein
MVYIVSIPGFIRLIRLSRQTHTRLISLSLYGEYQMASTTFSGPVTSTNGFIGTTTGNVVGDVTGVVTGSLVGFATLPTYTVTSANALTPKTAGKIIYVSNGLAGSPCIAVGNGTNWISPAGTAIAAS